MAAVIEIEKAISKLQKDDFTNLREWFNSFEAEKWDEEFENDVKTGKLDKIAKKAIESYHAGEKLQSKFFDSLVIRTIIGDKV